VDAGGTSGPPARVTAGSGRRVRGSLAVKATCGYNGIMEAGILFVPMEFLAGTCPTPAFEQVSARLGSSSLWKRAKAVGLGRE